MIKGHIVLYLSKGALIMKCILCAKEFTEPPKWLNETSALCPKCAQITANYKQPDNTAVNLENEKNQTGTTIQTVAKVIWILGAIAAVLIFVVVGIESFFSLISYLFTVFISGLMVYGLGEIIILLGQINDKLPNKRG